MYCFCISIVFKIAFIVLNDLSVVPILYKCQKKAKSWAFPLRMYAFSAEAVAKS